MNAVIIVCTIVIVAAVALLTVLVYRIGRKYGSVETSLERMDRTTRRLEAATAKLDAIPVIKNHVETLLDAFLEDRQKVRGVIPKMQKQIRKLLDHVFPEQHANGAGE